MFLIIGLGNPGKTYRETKHNLGFLVIDTLAKRHHIPVAKENHHALIGTGSMVHEKVILAKPQTYMNESGRAAASLLSWYHLPLEKVMVIYDDLDLPPGTIRIRQKGGAAGHKGVASIIEHLGSKDFPRIRIGVGKVAKDQTVHHVLGTIPKRDQKTYQIAIAQAADAVEWMLQHGILDTMNRFNGSA